ncbi:MAG: carbohydrate kinase family protein [Candidatus Xenobia bacterium]
MPENPTVTVIGGANLDIKGKASGQLVAHTSNPGRVDMSAGGVARNIAENLARLDVRSVLLAAFGKDPWGDMLLDSTRESGVEVGHSLIVSDVPTSLFVALMNHRGDLDSAIADMSIIDSLTPDYLQQKEDVLRQSEFLVLDADLPRESLIWLTRFGRQHGIPLCVEPVSCAKAQRIVDLLPDISMVTPNREEAEVLVGFPLEDMKGISEAGAELLRRGVQWVIITLGPEGVYVASEGQARFLPSIATIVADSVGAGDALTSGVVCGLVHKKPFFESVRMGIAAATMTLMTRDAVSRSLSWKALQEVMERVPTD